MKEARPSQNSQVAWRELDGAVVIISPADNFLHYLNPTASFIWKLADGSRTSAQIADRLATEFEVSAEQALADTRELFRELVEKNLIQLNGPSTRTGTDG